MSLDHKRDISHRERLAIVLHKKQRDRKYTWDSETEIRRLTLKLEATEKALKEAKKEAAFYRKYLDKKGIEHTAYVNADQVDAEQ